MYVWISETHMSMYIQYNDWHGSDMNIMKIDSEWIRKIVRVLQRKDPVHFQRIAANESGT